MICAETCSSQAFFIVVEKAAFLIASTFLYICVRVDTSIHGPGIIHSPHCKHHIHSCRCTVHHYCHQHLRHQFSSFSTQSATIVEDNDRKGRPRIRVLPARNNAHVAPMPQRYFQSHDQASSDHMFLVH
jgi:hypothetical protein